MSIYRLIYLCTIVNIELFLCGYILFGLKSRVLPLRILSPIISSGVGVLCFYFDAFPLPMTFLYSFTFIGSYFNLRFKEYIKFSILSGLILSLFDTFVGSLTALFFSNASDYLNERYVIFSGIISFIVFTAICLVLYRHKSMINKFFKNLTPLGLFLICLGSISALILYALLQGYYVGDINEQINKISIFIGTFAIITMLVIFFYLGSIAQKKIYQDNLHDKDLSLMQIQNNYMKNLLNEQTELRSFKHDYKAHMQTIKLLLDHNKYDDLSDYINDLNYGDLTRSNIYTRNLIIDSLFSSIFAEELENPSINIKEIGKLPDDFILNDYDCCTLFSNAFSNAKEAIQDTENPYIYMEIAQDDVEVRIRLKNSVKNSEIFNTDSDKDHPESHGYGVRNMIDVVNRAGGEINWIAHPDGVLLEIYLPRSKNNESGNM